MVRPQGRLTVKDLPNLTHDELFEVMAGAQSPGYYQMAVEELQRRFLENVRTEVKRLHGSSIRLEKLSWVLIVLTLVLAGSEIRKFLAERSSDGSHPAQQVAPAQPTSVPAASPHLTAPEEPSRKR